MLLIKFNYKFYFIITGFKFYLKKIKKKLLKIKYNYEIKINTYKIYKNKIYLNYHILIKLSNKN